MTCKIINSKKNLKKLYTYCTLKYLHAILYIEIFLKLLHELVIRVAVVDLIMQEHDIERIFKVGDSHWNTYSQPHRLVPLEILIFLQDSFS